MRDIDAALCQITVTTCFKTNFVLRSCSRLGLVAKIRRVITAADVYRSHHK